MKGQKIIRNVLLLFFAAVFCYSAFNLVQIWLDYRQGEELYNAAQEEFVTVEPPAIEPEEPEEPAEPVYRWPDIQVDFASLQQVNDDVIGWIWIDDSVINYPIVRGNDNEIYLDQTYKGTSNHAGSIFMDYRNKPDFSNSNTIIYGHNMKNGSMFASLKKFGNAEYYLQRKYFYILTPEGTQQYEIMAAFVTDALSEVYNRTFGNDEEKQSWINDVVKHSAIGTEVQPTTADYYVTLSTCVSGNNVRERFVVIGKRIEAPTNRNTTGELQ